MAEHNQKGTKAEDSAIDYLTENHYQILERNWKSGPREIDIIAKKDNKLIIVEVKARSEKNAESVDDLLSKGKMRNLVNAAEDYIFRNNSMLETRFDLISIVFGKRGKEINHIKGAFTPGVNW